MMTANTFMLISLSFSACFGQPSPQSVARARALVANMTLDEKILLVHGDKNGKQWV